MTKAELELLLTAARILRIHMSNHNSGDFKYLVDDYKMLRIALEPFENIIVDLTPNEAKFD